jgi:uncharacterized membrane protein YadS
MLANANLDTGTLIFWSAIALIVLVPVLGRCGYSAWKTHRELELKHEMIARGMSVSDIERVLAAGSDAANAPPQATTNVHKAPPGPTQAHE